MFLIKILFIVLILFIESCVSLKYSNYTLFRGIPIKNKHLEYFYNLTERSEINFWRLPGLLHKPVEFLVSPETRKEILRDSDTHKIYLTTIIDDVQRAFDLQTVKPYIRRKMDSFDWENYFRLKDIYSWLQDLSKTYPDKMQIQSIGKTYKDLDIMSVRIALPGCKMRSKVIIEGGIHAREWIAPAFVTYLIHQILFSQDSKDKDLRDVGLTYEWYFVPVVNPDGYEFSHTNDRLWRKNCHNDHGIDLNRNFEYAYGSVGVSMDPKSEIYGGTHAFSELESNALADFVRSKGDSLEYYFAFHSYGQYMIIPYGDSTKHVENFPVVKQIGSIAADRISRRYNTKYTVGTAYDTIGYMTSGFSTCWVKKSFQVPYAITFELRDNGNYGFALPPQLILPTCRETMDGIISLMIPKTDQFLKLNPRDYPAHETDSQGQTMLDKTVIIGNVLLFIIVRFD